MLRVAVVLGAPGTSQTDQVPSWIAELLQQLLCCPFATLQTLIYVEEPSSHPRSLGERLSDWLFGLYERWDESRRSTEGFSLANVALAQNLLRVTTLHITPGTDAAKVLREHDADVLLVLDADVAPIHAETARFGTLFLDISGTYGQVGQPPVWAQHVRQQVVTTRVLQTTAHGESKVVYETTTAVNLFSLAESRNPIYWKAVEILMRSLRALDAGGEAMLESLPLYQPVKHNPPVSLLHFAQAEVTRRVHARRPESVAATFAKWFIGIRKRTASIPFDSPANYHLLVSARDRFYADPFLFQSNGRTWLFFEDFRYDEGRALISCCELNQDGEPQSVMEVLRLPYHLSYPFVFEHDGDIYMVPESRENRKVSLYRAVDFPLQWTLDTELLTDVHIVDSTIHRDGDSWWLFAGVSNGRYSNSDELCLYYADDLRGPWLPHPQNPVISDVRRARPAGRVFFQDGRWIRPSQNCGPAYGYSLVFSEIEILSREHYREHVISTLEPGSVPGNTANHTFDRVDEFEVIDRFFIESRVHEASTLPIGSGAASTSNAQSARRE